MSSEDWWDETVTRKEACHEIAQHGADFDEFITEVGDKQEYKGGEVLAWLGY